MIPLFSIDRACRSAGGCAALTIFDRTNLATEPIREPGGVFSSDVTFNDPSKIYHLRFTRDTCRLDLEHRTSSAGQYYDIEISAFISRARLEVEQLIKRLKDHRLCAIVTDHNGFQRYAWDLNFFADYSTGSRRREPNGYTIRMAGSSDQDLIVISGNVVTDTNGSGVTFTPGGGGGVQIEVNPVQLAFIPSYSGNLTNLNEFVRASDGTLWFIDWKGDAECFNRGPGQFEISTPGEGYIIQDAGGQKWKITISSFGAITTQKV